MDLEKDFKNEIEKMKSNYEKFSINAKKNVKILKFI